LLLAAVDLAYKQHHLIAPVALGMAVAQGQVVLGKTEETLSS
jgi:hypothetical protein